MKKLNLIIIFIILSFVSYGQTNCSELKEKNKTLVSKLSKKDETIKIQNRNILKLKTEIKYYKETIGLLNTRIQKEKENIIFRINGVKGKSDEGLIIIEGLIENKGAVDKFQVATIELVDPKGNQYKTYKYKFGEDSYIPKFQRNLPIKFNIKFDKIIDETPIIKALILNIYGGSKYPGRTYKVMFKNLPVSWE